MAYLREWEMLALIFAHALMNKNKNENMKTLKAMKVWQHELNA